MPVTKKITDLALTNVAAGDDVPIAQGGFLKRAKLGQANGLTILDSAGMPLDSAGRKLIAYGSNSNGTYIRFADGTQVCYANVVATQGNPYGLFGTWLYPAAFVAAPVISAIRDYSNQRIANTIDPYNLPITVDCRNPTSSSVGISVLVGSGGAVAGDFASIGIVAIGRWY